MNTFENELSTKNLVNLLSTREGVEQFVLDVEDSMSLVNEKFGEMIHVEGPARVLVVID